MKKYTKSTIEYLEDCRLNPPKNRIFHNYVVYIDNEMLQKKTESSPEFYRDYFKYIKDSATYDSKRGFEVKEIWHSWDPETDDWIVNEEWTKNSGIPESELLKMKKEKQAIYAMVNLELYPKFKYISDSDIEINVLKTRVEKLESDIQKIMEKLKI